MNIYELEARYDSRLSFYGKAKVAVNGNVETLFSYDSEVAKIENGKLFIRSGFWNYSQTTRRHVKEFAKQHGFDVKEDGVLYEL